MDYRPGLVKLLLVAMLLVEIHAIADYCDIVVLGVKSAVQRLNITTVALAFRSFASLFWSVSEWGVYDSFCVFQSLVGWSR